MKHFWLMLLALSTVAFAQRDPLVEQLRTSPTARYGAKWTAQAWVRPDPLAAKFAAYEREGLTDQEVLRQIQSLQSRATLSTEEAFRFGYLAARARFIPTATVAYPTSAMRAAEAMAKSPTAVRVIRPDSVPFGIHELAGSEACSDGTPASQRVSEVAGASHAPSLGPAHRPSTGQA